MTGFVEQADAIAGLLEEESASGAREPGLDRRLQALRGSWTALDAGDRAAVADHTVRIAALVKERPAPVPATAPFAPLEEEAEAMLALQGLDRIEVMDEAPLRVYAGDGSPDSLLEHMNYETWRPGQKDAVEAALAGRDSLIVMPTGGGKSLCYQLPGLASDDLTIVVSPLIALMSDQVRRLRMEGHPAVMFASGLSDEVMNRARDDVRNGTARIAYCSPERFASSSFLDLLSHRKIALMAIDEAHCLSEWGHDFRPDYLRLPKVAERLGRPTVMACTATATQQVADEIAQRMGLEDPARIHSGFDRPNLSFDTVAFEGKGSMAKKKALLEYGLKDPGNRPAIVYCGTRKNTEELGEDLRSIGINAVSYHAGMPSEERASAQIRFMEGDADVVVATNAFGMGIDKADVRSVWHWAIPSSVEAYYQEAGRAGRDGLPARAVLLAMRSDLGRLVRFNENKTVEAGDVQDYLGYLRGLADEDGTAVIEAPRRDDERIRLAVAERADALVVDPASGGRLLVTLAQTFDPYELSAACRVAKDRGWKAYRAVEAFSFSDQCRRRQLLDHFGDASPTSPSGRCCDVCDPEGRLPDPDTLVVRKSRANPKKANSRPVEELDPADHELYEIMRAWRLQAAGDKPAFHVASNRTLAAIVTAKPRDEDELLAVSGVGPSFREKYGSDVLRMISQND